MYETNTASTKIWDSLGFKRIGRVPGCGNLRSFTDPVDAIIYGRDLKAEGENEANEERFDKIRYYLRHSSYPQGADRSEKSRLRSAATHYKLIPAEEGIPEKLMLKDKEVISDPQQQYDIAKQTHLITHGGINKTTAVIATKFHWVRIKETVSHVIKDCVECKVSPKNGGPGRSDSIKRPKSADDTAAVTAEPPPMPQNPPQLPETPPMRPLANLGNLSPNHISPHQFSSMDPHVGLPGDPDMHDLDPSYDDMALDPTIIAQIQQMAQDGFDGHHHHDYPAGLADYVDSVGLTQQHQDPNPFTNGQQHPQHPGDQAFNGQHQHPDQSPYNGPQQHQLPLSDSPFSNGTTNHHPHLSDPATAAAFGNHRQLTAEQPFNTGVQHHDPVNFNSGQQLEHFIHNPGQAMMTTSPQHQQQHDHIMDDGTGANDVGVGLNNMQPMQNVLHMDYMNSTGNGAGDYKQQ